MNGKTLFAFVVGAAIGAAGAYVYFNKKYFGPIPEVEEEQPPIKSDGTLEVESEPDTAEKKPSDKVEYQKIAKQYTEEPEKKGPYVINREEFNDGTVQLTATYSYFEDGILTDEYNEVLDDADVKEALGEDFVEHFEEDLVYIRNEQRNCDYEILREGITYHEPPEEE